MQLFGKKPDVKETVRTSQQQIRKSQRELEREAQALRREEEKLIREIKAAAKSNNQQVMRVLAKSLVRVRGQIAKLQGSSANLRGVSTNLTTAAAASRVAGSMATATGAMKQMQCSVNPAAVAATAQAFAKESAKMDMAQEMMGDAVDGLDDEAAEDESSELVSQVLDEIGVDLSAALGAAPQRKAAARQPAAAAAEDDEELGDLSARLAALRG